MNRSEEILEAAEYCMRQKGFYQTSVQNIARQANVSVGLIYKYYKNKEAIIEALIKNVVQRMIDSLKDALDNLAHAGKVAHSAHGVVSVDVEKSIVLLIDISAEATRNERIRKIINDAWQMLKENFITQEQALNPSLDADIIQTRLYIMSLIIDGMTIRRYMKQREIDGSVMSFLDVISHDINQNSVA
ncbi:TetR family transcriptional regulator [Pantoea agglomerans]|uniref:TetR/AcrR family transcriptional regulator n=1 Tax=Pantoea TaxID=53335 RepID=UPI000BF24B23|nr:MULTISPECIES: TetR/AcrR family transcriptional regulator [Pantoea]MDE8557846.1 TetR/AcrR family transcriptional regulator [Pantoea vagans]MDE8577414.1 TetR/AcrR family transcriptional regulator [Pantoea vagans]PEI06004.1 TetR family transcriptional regulator [Pantoea agglomerans]GME42136.1 TetR/AcrR family transcriptional regulator [Pantoea sp. QMID3]GME57198.1 TetR/AcrR family transcriptional regulator [Pantoea sp. QMID4]